MPSSRPFLRHALAMALLLALPGACSERENGRRGEGPPPPVVETVVLAPESISDVIELVGQLDAAHSVVLKTEMRGVIESIEFIEGEPVSEADPLFRLRDAEQRARLREARAELALARDVYDRTRALAKRKAESAAELNRASAQNEIALARVELAQIELDRTIIRAPFDGVMGERMVSPGERVSPGGDRGPGGGAGGGGESTGLARIDSLDPLELIFTIPETVISIVQNGVAVRLRVAPFPGEVFGGEVYFVAPRVDSTSRRMLVKARVPNPEHKLRPGLFAKLKISLADREAALMVPEDAVLYSDEGTYVWRVDAENLAERRPVELGIRQGGRVELRRGVGPGDRVVTAGTHKVVPGREVQSVSAPSESSGRIGL